MTVVSKRIKSLRIRFSQPGSKTKTLQIKISSYIKPLNVPKCSAESLILFLDQFRFSYYSINEEVDLFTRHAKSWNINCLHQLLCCWCAHPDSLTWSKREKFELDNKFFETNTKNRFRALRHTRAG